MKPDFTIILIIICVFIIISGIKKYLFDRWVNSTVDNMLKDLDSSEEVSLEDESNGIIAVTDSGFTISDKTGKLLTKVDWDNVLRIVTYKIDLITTDRICLGWEEIKDGPLVETHEEMVGFKLLCESMTQKFKSIQETWFMDVAHPAFETNLTTLWSKN